MIRSKRLLLSSCFFEPRPPSGRDLALVRERVDRHGQIQQQGRHVGAWLIPAQECPETGLLEMVVAGQGVGESTAGHHGKRNAVRMGTIPRIWYYIAGSELLTSRPSEQEPCSQA